MGNYTTTIPGHAVTINDVIDLINSIVQYALIVSVTIAIGFIVYGGFLMATSGATEANFTKGKTTLYNAMIGLAVILALGLIVHTIANIAANPTNVLQ